MNGNRSTFPFHAFFSSWNGGHRAAQIGLLALLLAMPLAACDDGSSHEGSTRGAQVFEPTMAPTPTREPAMTPTPTPEPTMTPMPTPEPTMTPTPTLESTMTPTPTLEPTMAPTTTPEPTMTPTPTLEPTMTPMPTPEPTMTPTPNPEPMQNASEGELSLALNASNDSEYARLGLIFDFVVSNPTSVAVEDVTLAFWTEEPGWMAFPISLHESCEEPVCLLGSFSGYQSMTGQVAVYTEFQPTNEVTLHGEVSWLGRTLDIRRADAQVYVSVVEDNEPGAILWSESYDASSLNCGVSVAVDTETVYAVFQNVMYAVSRSTGEKLWRIDTNVAMFQPVPADQSIYVTGHRLWDNWTFVRSLDASSGTLVWEHVVDRHMIDPVVVYDGSVFFTSHDWLIDGRPEYSYLTSLDVSTGTVNWEYRVGESISTPPVRFGNEIFFGTYNLGPNDYLYSVDSISGELTRRYNTVGGHYETPLIANGNAYVVPGNGSIYSMDLTTGIKRWQKFEETGRYGKPVLSNGIVFVLVYDEDAGEYYALHALHADAGGLIWSYSTEEIVFGEEVYRETLRMPTAADGVIYVPSDLTVLALDVASGRQIWEGFYRSTCAPLIAVDDVLYGNGFGFMVFAIQAR